MISFFILTNIIIYIFNNIFSITFKDKKVLDDKIVLLKAISNVIKSGMDIVGVHSPEKM